MRAGPLVSRPTTSRASTISAPKRWAWATARWARSAPDTPLGEAEVVLDRGALARLPSRCLPLDDDGLESLGCAVHGRGQTGGATADDAEVVERLPRDRPQSERVGQHEHGWRPQRLTVGDQHEGQVGRVGVGGALQPLGLLVVLEVEPAVVDVVPGEEGLDVVAPLRPAVADDPEPALGAGVLLPPVAEQVVEDGVEALFRRVPRLQEVVVEADVVDGLDGDVRVGVGGEEDELGLRSEHPGLLEELDAGHLGHPLIRRDQTHLPVAQRELGQDLQGLGTRCRPDDLELGTVLPAQVAGDGLRDRRIVVDRQDCRFRHLYLSPARDGHYRAVASGRL